MALDLLMQAISNPTLVEVLESTFSKNIAKNGGGMYSSAVSRDQKLVDIKLSVEVNFSSNVAFEHGGGIAMKNQGTLSLSGGVFLDNNATISGGGAYIQVCCLVTILNLMSVINMHALHMHHDQHAPKIRQSMYN